VLDKVTESEAAAPAKPVAAPTTEPGTEPGTEPARGDARFPTIGRVALAGLQAILMIAVLAGSYFIAQRLIATKPEPSQRPAFQTVYTIDTVTAARADNRPSFIVYGQTVAARNVDLRALVAGQIVSVNDDLRAGSRIAEGAVLLEIDPFEYRGALAEARANLAEARGRIAENEALIAAEEARREPLTEQLDLARADLERMATLRERGTGTQQQLEARRLVVSQRQTALDQVDTAIGVQKARLTQLQASIERLEWRVEQAERNLASTELVVPFTGIVRSTTAEIGRNVSANDVVVALYEADTLDVRFTLSDAQYGRLAASETGIVGKNVDVRWSVGRRSYDYSAIIDRLGADIASARGGVEVFARIDALKDNVALRPGAFVEVTVPDRLFEGTIRVPDSALYGADRVYVEIDGKLQERVVEVAAFDGEEAIIASGLEAGDEVLITRITEVSEGLLVRREGEEPPAHSAGEPDETD
jgi:RND family efflux transporter MFP subunit